MIYFAFMKNLFIENSKVSSQFTETIKATWKPRSL